MSNDFLTQPIDPATKERLKASGLRMDLADSSDAQVMEAWSDSTNRGFHGGALSPERHAEYLEANKARRNTGVWDENSSSPEPVGTSNSWVSRLAVPGERTIDSWAISSVTVASTHSKRGIARALLEAELAAAHAAGLPMAMLTVSESSLYQRYGFAPAAFAADYEFDISRVKWTGPTPNGRVEYITLEKFAEHLAELHERMVPKSPGMVDIWPLRVKQIAGLSAADEDRAKKLRAIRYVSPAGEVGGIALYRLSGGDDDFVKHTLTAESLVIETAEAGQALWRYLLEVPLVAKVKVEHRPLDESVLWMISDWRAANVTLWEHQYLRILDVREALESRRYYVDGEIVFDVSDPLGYTSGRWHLQVRDGVGHLTATSDVVNVPTLTLGVAELSALYLGGVSTEILINASRVEVDNLGGSTSIDLFQGAKEPYLSIWY